MIQVIAHVGFRLKWKNYIYQCNSISRVSIFKVCVAKGIRLGDCKYQNDWV